MNDNNDPDRRYREAYRMMQETSIDRPLPWERLHEQERNWFRAYANAYLAVATEELRKG